MIIHIAKSVLLVCHTNDDIASQRIILETVIPPNKIDQNNGSLGKG